MESGQGEFYITTPIYYVNDKPHIGHAYTTIVADTLARWRGAQGERVRFLTGTDENSQKTVDAAKKSGEEVHAYTDRLAALWESAWAHSDQQHGFHSYHGRASRGSGEEFLGPP